MSADGTLVFSLPSGGGQPGNLILDPSTLQMFGGASTMGTKKNAGQRLIMPKPVSGSSTSSFTHVSGNSLASSSVMPHNTNTIQSLTSMLPVVMQPTLHLKTTASKTTLASKVVKSVISSSSSSVVLSTPLTISVSSSNTPVTTVSPSTQSHPCSDDILAKAAESIFSEVGGACEISPPNTTYHNGISPSMAALYGTSKDEEDVLHIVTEDTSSKSVRIEVKVEEKSLVKPLTVITDSAVLGSMQGSTPSKNAVVTTSVESNISDVIASTAPSYMDISPVSTLSPSDIPTPLTYSMPTMSAISNLSSALVSTMKSGTTVPLSSSITTSVSNTSTTYVPTVSSLELISSTKISKHVVRDELPKSFEDPGSVLDTIVSPITTPQLDSSITLNGFSATDVSSTSTPIAKTNAVTSNHHKSPHKKRKKEKKDKKDRKEKKRRKKERKRAAKEAAEASLTSAGDESTPEKNHKRILQGVDSVCSHKKPRTTGPQQELSDIVNTMETWAASRDINTIDKTMPGILKEKQDKTVNPIIGKIAENVRENSSKKTIFAKNATPTIECSVYDFPDSPENLTLQSTCVPKTTPKHASSNISNNGKDYLADLNMNEKSKGSSIYNRGNVSHFIIRSKSEEADIPLLPNTITEPSLDNIEDQKITKTPVSSGKKKKKHKSKTHFNTDQIQMENLTVSQSTVQPPDAMNESFPKKGHIKSPHKKADGESSVKKKSKSKRKSKNKNNTIEPKENPVVENDSERSTLSSGMEQPDDNVLTSPNKSNDDLVIDQSTEKSKDDSGNAAGLETFFKALERGTKEIDAVIPNSLVFSASELPDVLAKVESLSDDFSMSLSKPVLNYRSEDMITSSKHDIAPNIQCSVIEIFYKDSDNNGQIEEENTLSHIKSNNVLDTPTLIHKTTPKPMTSSKKRRRLNLSPDEGPSSPDFMKDFRSLEVDVDLNENDDAHFVTPSFGMRKDTKKRERSSTPPCSLSQLSPLPTLNTPAPPQTNEQLSPPENVISARHLSTSVMTPMSSGLELLSAMDSSLFSPLPSDSLLTPTPTSPPASMITPPGSSSQPARHSHIATLAKGLEQPRTPLPVSTLSSRVTKRTGKLATSTATAIPTSDITLDTSCSTTTVTTTQLSDLPGNSYKNELTIVTTSETILSTSSCNSNINSTNSINSSFSCSVTSMPPPTVQTTSPSKSCSVDEGKGSHRSSHSSFEPSPLAHLSPSPLAHLSPVSSQINSPKVQSPYSLDAMYNNSTSATPKTSPQCAVVGTASQPQPPLTPQSIHMSQSMHADHSGRCSVDSITSNRSTSRPYSAEPISNSPTSMSTSHRFTSPKQGVFSPPPNITVGSQKLHSSTMPIGSTHSAQHGQHLNNSETKSGSSDFTYPPSNQYGSGYRQFNTPATSSLSGTTTFSFSLSSAPNTPSYTSSTHMPNTNPTTTAPCTRTSTSTGHYPVVSSTMYGHMPSSQFPPFPYPPLPYPSSKHGSKPDNSRYGPALNLSTDVNNFTPEASNRSDCRNPPLTNVNKMTGSDGGTYMNSYETMPLYHRNISFDPPRQDATKQTKEDPPSLRHLGPPIANSSVANYYPNAMTPQTSPRQSTGSTSRLQHPPSAQDAMPRHNSQQSTNRNPSYSMNSPSYEPPEIQLNNRGQKGASHSSLPSQQQSSRSHNQEAPVAQTPTPQPMPPAPINKPKSKSKSSNKSKSKKSKPNASLSAAHKNYEVDTNLSNSIFEAPNRTMTPMFNPSQGMVGPGMRGQLSDGPTYLPSNLFVANSASRPLSSNSSVENIHNNPLHQKNPSGPPASMADMSQMPAAAFNSLFSGGGPGVRSQNGLGPPFNFQAPGFPMNTMGGHTSMGQSSSNSGTSTPHISNNMMPSHPMSHGAHHMANFPLSTNFFDMNPNPDPSALNMSPIKFPGSTNPMHHQSGVPNPMDPHQGSSFYHNRTHLQHHPMAFNNILAHNAHHGFDARTNAMGAAMGSMGTPFGGPHGATPFGMPHLNFSMHDH